MTCNKLEHETYIIWLPTIMVTITVIFGIWSNLQTRKSNNFLSREISAKLRPNLLFTSLQFYENDPKGQLIDPVKFTQLLNMNKSPRLSITCRNKGLISARNVKMRWLISKKPINTDTIGKTTINRKHPIPGQHKLIFSTICSSKITLEQPYYVGFDINFDYEPNKNAYYFFSYIIYDNLVELDAFDSTY